LLYKDDQDDLITLANDQDLAEVIKMQGTLLRLLLEEVILPASADSVPPPVDEQRSYTPPPWDLVESKLEIRMRKQEEREQRKAIRLEKQKLRQEQQAKKELAREMRGKGRSRGRPAVVAVAPTVQAPAPVPAPVPLVYPTYYSDSYKGCFDGNGMVEMEDGSKKKVKEVQPGDVVRTEFGAHAVAKVTRSPVLAERPLVVFNDILLTRKHPVFVDGKWHRPTDVGTIKTVWIDYWYNFELEGGSNHEDHAVWINDVLVATLGKDVGFADTNEEWGSGYWKHNQQCDEHNM
jgi:hypothetical protein